MTITKKVISVLCLAALLLSVLCIPAFAKNNHDEDFIFVFQPGDQTDYTYMGYPKEDDSGTYLSYTHGNAQSCRFSVYGGDQEYQYMCSVWRNETKGGSTLVFRGETGCIRQYVFENRALYNRLIPYAYLHGAVEVVDGGVLSIASGVWSPDTLGTYPYFN